MVEYYFGGPQWTVLLIVTVYCIPCHWVWAALWPVLSKAYGRSDTDPVLHLSSEGQGASVFVWGEPFALWERGPSQPCCEFKWRRTEVPSHQIQLFHGWWLAPIIQPWEWGHLGSESSCTTQASLADATWNTDELYVNLLAESTTN